MIDQTLTLEELKEQTLEDVLRYVAREQKPLNVRLPNGETVAIQPSLRLKPLPALEGSVPEGWKDALYG